MMILIQMVMISGSFTITAIRTGRESSSSGNVTGTVGEVLNGTYGALTVSSNGSYLAYTRSGADVSSRRNSY